jgi:Flp pilus assembly pilin Flp
MTKLFELIAREDGQTMAEYGTVLTVITIACLTAFVLLAAAATGAYERVGNLLGA